ncbi:DUF4244 domain-containing protein [Propionibacterium australiense]|uniref:DUF4244 domain-containing protein n=1 Tax=Propionibacterium australiense TaxID=119981 RepID=A0A383S7P8_9ACTN|nr:DUF4244 domain-containing protein [Propionibacterium australiense]RLP09788.1 DUF4244 domain-containing protein [Propionibacterium australiense]RLP10163.1 DUF4244 domain-containing protein [Propionibacterium australiense]SYZ33266.1 Protein of unknown function DUF4244 [Propionibacterium australiense]VEH89240.1 Uncharacterised protein [Propionibacterium australiense]
MTAQIIPLHPHEGVASGLVDADGSAAFADVPVVADEPLPGPLRRAYERGMATAEYAVGILAAAALALVLLHVFTDNSFFQKMLKFVVDLIGKIAPMIGS